MKIIQDREDEKNREKKEQMNKLLQKKDSKPDQQIKVPNKIIRPIKIEKKQIKKEKPEMVDKMI